jgi:hypothetical protein
MPIRRYEHDSLTFPLVDFEPSRQPSQFISDFSKRYGSFHLRLRCALPQGGRGGRSVRMPAVSRCNRYPPLWRVYRAPLIGTTLPSGAAARSSSALPASASEWLLMLRE